MVQFLRFNSLQPKMAMPTIISILAASKEMVLKGMQQHFPVKQPIYKKDELITHQPRNKQNNSNYFSFSPDGEPLHVNR